jgi:hypothetical protein
MSFEHPQGLWLLALGVPIIVFHLYRGRVRRLPVPTLLFWEQILIEEERKTALKRLRHYASLLLNLLALAVLTSAVAAPEVPGITRPRARYAVILDNTASMGTVEADGRTRLAGALDLARAFVHSLGLGDRVSVHDLTGPRAPFTADLDRVAESLSAPPLASRVDVRERVLAALAAGDDVTAVFFTDRMPGGVDDLLEKGRLRVARVGAARENAGWVSGLAIRRPGERKLTLALEAAAFGASSVARTAILSFEGTELARRPLEIDPGARLTVEWDLDPARFAGRGIEKGGRALVALEPGDALALDDAASFVLPPLSPPPVVVFHGGKPDGFLLSALHALREGGIAGEIGAAPVERYAEMRGRIGEGVIVVFDRVAPPSPLGRGGFLVVGAPGGREVERPTIADWDRDAPPNRMVDYSSLVLRRARILEGAPLLRAVEGPVAVWSARGGRAVVELGFAPEEGSAMHVSFPLFLFNFVEWAAFRGTRAYPAGVAAGEPLRPERPIWIDEGQLSLALPDRAERVAVRKGVPEGAPRAAPGFVRAFAADRTETIAVNLFDAAESDLREPEARPPGTPLPPPAPWHAKIPYAALAAAFVLALLILEWWLFHRGLI